MLNIYNYIAYNLCNYIAAINVMENIENTINSLKHSPYMGTYYSSEFNRFTVYKRYLIFYEIKENKGIINIKRITHGSVNTRLY